MLDLVIHMAHQAVARQRLKRVPEPLPVMLGEDRCEAYSTSAHDENVSVVHDFCADIVSDWRLSRARVLDIACGGGQCLFTLAERFPEFEITGLDASPEMLEICRARASRLGGDRFRFLQGDMTELRGVPDATFDVVTCAMSAHHAEDLGAVARMLREIVRVAKPGGGVLVVDLGRLKTASLNRWYVDWKGRDYSPQFFAEFRDSMAAAFSATELRVLVDSMAVPGLQHYAFAGLPVLQFVIREPRRGAGPLRGRPARPPALEAEYQQLRQIFRMCGLSPETAA